MITLDYLNEQLQAFEHDLQAIKDNGLRIEGAISVTKHLIAQFKDPEPPKGPEAAVTE